MKKNDLKLIAKIYSASVLHAAMECGADSPLLTESELNYIQQQTKKIARSIHKNVFAGSLDEVIYFVQLTPNNNEQENEK